LRKPAQCTQILRNAFDGVPFGANKHGILVATTDDHLHACESGIILNLAEVAYGGLTQAESKVFEQIIHSLCHLMPIKCPVRIAPWDNKEEFWQPHSFLKVYFIK
jgi:hypothetical protein